jgi:hypothetical protein
MNSAKRGLCEWRRKKLLGAAAVDGNGGCEVEVTKKGGNGGDLLTVSRGSTRDVCSHTR